MTDKRYAIARKLHWTPDVSFQERDVELGGEMKVNVFAPAGGCVELTADVLRVLSAFGRGATSAEVAAKLGMDPSDAEGVEGLAQMLVERGFLRPAEQPADSPQRLPPSFLVSAHDCGGTLFRWFIDTHPNIACASPHRLSLPFREMMEAAAQTDAFAGLKLKHSEALHMLGETLDELLMVHARLRQRTSWVWASRDHDLTLHFLNDLFRHRARFVCIVRHPLDAADSSARKYQNEGWHSRRMIDLLHKHDSPEGAYAHYWVDVYRRVRAFRDACQDQLLIVRYEDLVRNPVAEMTRVFGFLGEKMPAGLIEHAFKRPHETLEGGWESFGFLKATAVEANHVNLWRKWDPALVRQVSRIVEQEMEAWGYSLSAQVSAVAR